ncbi:uncharacterized protein LOC119679949 [Teleopsis dalmanni]|uniref:uncharacterized protein LOC119679949 n=1 Tax=Teleopsis dalmanni TaxID=139649 RepID=UPI0018CCC1E8|nr:uncharacterized protein LOC119679949 [Teleopsis dalmanni]
MSKFITLPDDCLYQIFSKLSLVDQVKCSEVCWRFHSTISCMIWRVKYKNFKTNSDIFNPLTNPDYQRVFTAIVKYIEELNIVETRNHAFASYLGRYTYRPELGYYFRFDYEHLNSFICDDSSLHDGYVRILAGCCPNIKKLHVSSEHVTGEYISLFNHLEVLYMPHCSIKQNIFNELCCKFKLTHLDIRACELDISILYKKPNTTLIELAICSKKSFTTNCIQNFENFLKLKYLKLDDIIYDDRTENFIKSIVHNIKEVQYFIRFETNQRKFQGEILPKMTKLKKLYMWFNGYFTSPFDNDSLEELHLIHLYKHQCDQSWMPNLKNLKHIYLGAGVDLISVTKHWLINLISQIQSGAGNPLVLHLFKTEIDYSEEGSENYYIDFLNHVKHIVTVKHDIPETHQFEKNSFIHFEFY